MLSDMTDQMNFWERSKSFLGRLAMEALVNLPHPVDTVAKKVMGESARTGTAIVAESQLLFIHSEEFLDFPRPILHKIVYIGGIGQKDPKPLTGVSVSHLHVVWLKREMLTA